MCLLFVWASAGANIIPAFYRKCCVCKSISLPVLFVCDRDKKERRRDKQEKQKGNQNGDTSPTHNPMKVETKEGKFDFSNVVSNLLGVGQSIHLQLSLLHCGNLFCPREK